MAVHLPVRRAFLFPDREPSGNPPKKPENVSEHTDAQAAHPYSLRMGSR